MHTYLALPNGVTPAEVEVVGLDTLSFADKVGFRSSCQSVREATGQVAKTESKQEGSITFPGEVDRVYRGAPAMALLKANDRPFLEVHKDNYADFVVWNPHQAKSDALADMEADGWRRFVCVEPGHASTWVTLQAGESSVSTQRLVPA
jgi:glucose-6-phosphate 1-epimerase